MGLTTDKVAELCHLCEAALSSVRYADDTRIRRCAHTHSNAAMSFINSILDLLKQGCAVKPAGSVIDLETGKPPTIPGKPMDRRKLLEQLDLLVPCTGDRWRDVATVLANAAWHCVCDPETCPARVYCPIASRRRDGDLSLVPLNIAISDCAGALLRWAQSQLPVGPLDPLQESIDMANAIRDADPGTDSDPGQAVSPEILCVKCGDPINQDRGHRLGYDSLLCDVCIEKAIRVANAVKDTTVPGTEAPNADKPGADAPKPTDDMPDRVAVVVQQAAVLYHPTVGYSLVVLNAADADAIRVGRALRKVLSASREPYLEVKMNKDGTVEAWVRPFCRLMSGPPDSPPSSLATRDSDLVSAVEALAKACQRKANS